MSDNAKSSTSSSSSSGQPQQGKPGLLWNDRRLPSGSDLLPAGAKKGLSRTRKVVLDVFHLVILVLSVLLIVYISYDTFNRIPFLEDKRYMTFQFCVCLVFIADFFVELWFTPSGKKREYVRRRWLFLLLSIPVLNIVDATHVELSPDLTYFVRFLPLARGVMAMVIVFSYMAANKISGLFISYTSILVMANYFGGLIFFEREMPVNPDVTSYWDAFFWCAAQTTTLNCTIIPYTLAGKILAVILSGMGIIMFPLFTVFMQSLIKRERERLKLLNILQHTKNKDNKAEGKVANIGTKVVNSPKNA